MSEPRLNRVLRLWMACTGEQQQDIATDLGITPSMLSRLMSGEREAGPELRTRVADWLLGAHTRPGEP